MQINITFRHMEPVNPLKNYIEERLQKIKKYLHEPVEAHVVLSTEKFRHIIEVNIMAGNGTTIHGMKSMEDVHAAIDGVVDKIERQIKKQLDKSKHPKRKQLKSP
ncbi:MAG: ribosome-associated translation inhibitor RaiA [Deltaproteobacteria bacterium]|nr:ribosome-associated translation inhibitor RaiA [Deltaproteobacteria bacterium]